MTIETKYLFIGIIFALIGGTICGIYGHIDYNYDVYKCSNMKNSNYEFTHDVQLNAQYSQDCFKILNHPFAYHIKVGGFIFLGVFNGAIIPAFIFFIKKLELFGDD